MHILNAGYLFHHLEPLNYTGSITNPDFKDIYAPLDGFIVNRGIKLKL